MGGPVRTRTIPSFVVSLLVMLLTARSAAAQPVAIPRGHEEEIAVMLGRDESLPGGCRWAGADIGPSEVRARYACGASPAVALRLSLPGRGPAGAVAAGRFDVSVDDPARTALRDAVAARVRGGDSRPMVVRVDTRPVTHHIGPFELGRAHAGGDDLARSPWLDLPLALLVLALLARALRTNASRRDLAWTALAAATLFTVARFGRSDVPVHSDVLRDLLFARDCVEGGRCHALGPESSLTVVRHGTLWLRFPEWVARLGGTERALRAIVELVDALAVVVLTLGVRRHGGHRTAALAAPVAGVAALWLTGHPLLWHPSVLPLFASLYAVLLLDALANPSLLGWASVGASLGLLLDVHPSAFALVPCFALVVGARAGQPWQAVPLSLLAMLGALTLPSPVLLLSRVAWAVGDRRAAILALGTALAIGVGCTIRRRAAALDARALLTLAALLHAATLALLVLGSRLLGLRYLVPTLPLAALVVALWVPPRPAFVAALVALATTLAAGRVRYADGGARWSIAEARAVLQSAPLRGRSWADLAARLHWVDGEGLRAVGGLLSPRGHRGDVAGPDAMLVVRTRRTRLSPRPPASWAVVPLDAGDVAVVRVLRSYLPLGATRACVDAACVELDLGASLSVAGLMPFSPRSFTTSPPLEALARGAAAGRRLRLTLVVAVPGGGGDHRIALAADSAWRIDGLSGSSPGRPQSDGSILIEGTDAATGRLEISAPTRGTAAPMPAPQLVETATDETAIDALLRRP